MVAHVARALGGCMYLITELCAGGSLAERLEQQRREALGGE